MGFEFAGWQFDDNNIIDFTQNYSYPRDMTVKTNWNESSVGIQFESQYSFIDLSYSLKSVAVSGKVGDLDTSGANSGLPMVVNCQDYGLNFVGFFTSTNAGTRVLESTLVKDLVELASADGSLVLYAHYTTASPSLNDNFETTKTQVYSGNEIKFFNISTSDFSNNQAGIISYSYLWTKDNAFVSSDNFLSLKNVLDSGDYTCTITAKHEIWGQSVEANYTFTVNITPMQVEFELEDTKTFDMTTSVFGAKNNSYFDVSNVAPSFDSHLVGNRNIVANFRYNKDDTLENVKNNFVPRFKNELVDSYTFTQMEDEIILTLNLEGKIIQSEFEVNVNGKGYYNSKPHEISILEFITQDFKNFLSKFGLSIIGKVKTNSSEIKTYFASKDELLVEFEIIDHNDGLELTSNFVGVLSGQYEILNADELRTLYIEKLGSINIENGLNQEISTPKFSLIWVLEDGTTSNISTSGEYNHGEAYIQVINENNSNNVQITVNNKFDGEIKIVANSFIYNIGSKNTTTALLEWQKVGAKIDVGGDKTLSYSFDDEEVDHIQAIFRNYAIINYDFLLGDEKETVKVYNTGEDLTLLNISNRFDGLELLGWFNDKNYNNQFTGKTFKSIDEITLYAKYELLDISLNINLNEKEFEESFSKAYDGRTEKLALNVANSCDYINYSIELFKDGKKLRSFASSSLELDLKNAIESGEYRFVVTAKVLGLNLVKTSEISRTIEILRKDYTISQAIEKVYDGDSKLKQNGNDYVVVSLNPSEEVIENFKIVGTYNSSKIDANEILITDISALDDASVENYNFTFDFTGSITKKNLSLNIGDYSQNTKQFDGEIFEKDFNNDIATGLVENETLSLNVSTKQSDVGQYSFENSALDYTVSIYNQLGEEVTSCYDISLSGGMEIGKEVFSTQGLSLSDLEVVYDAQPHLVLLNGRENLLPGIEIEYSFQIDGKEQEVIFDGDSLIVAPIEVGTYTIVANIISNGNYSISGETSFSATLKINLQKNNFVFWRLKLNVWAIKTFEVNSK